MAKSFSPNTTRKLNESGQVGLPQVLALVILVFVIFTVGRVLFNATPLDPDANDGVKNAIHGQGQNDLMNIGFVVMSGIVIISAMASIVIRFF